MALAALWLAGAGGGAIAAQADSSAGGLEEVIVTAQKVVQAAQKVSRAIDVVGSEEIKNSGAVSLDQVLATIPGFGTDGFQAQPSMRGIGNDLQDPINSPSPVVVNIDGAGASGGARGGADPGLQGAMFDIDQVEVVRGPSGTMQGQNALGGSINVITKAPKLHKFDLNAGLQVGNYRQRVVNFGINLPLGDSFALRGAFQHQSHDAYSWGEIPGGGRTAMGGWQDIRNGRVKLLWQPSDSFKATVTASFAQDNSSTLIVGNTDKNFNPPLEMQSSNPSDPWLIPAPSGTFPVNHNPGPKSYRYQGDIQWNAGWATLTYLPTYTQTKPTCQAGTVCNADSRVSNELRLVSDPGSRIQWQVGLYQDRFVIKNGNPCVPGGSGCTISGNANSALNINEVITLADAASKGLANPALFAGNASAGARDTKSAYFSLVIPATEHSRFRGGMRFAKDNSGTDPTGFIYGVSLPTGGLGATRFTYGPTGSVVTNATYAQALAWLQANPGNTVSCYNCVIDFALGPYSFSGSSSPVNWNLTWEWDQTPTSMIYAGLNTGYRAGGVQQNLVPPQTFPPEEVLQFSLGDKARFWDNKAQWNTEIYYYQFKNYQVQTNNLNAQSFAYNGVTYNQPDLTPYYTGSAGVTYPDQIASGSNNLPIHTGQVVVPHQSFIGLESTFTALVTHDDKVTVSVSLADQRFGNLYDSAGHNLTGTQVSYSPAIAGYLNYQHTFNNVFGGQLKPQFTARYTSGTPVANERYIGNFYMPWQYQKAYLKYDANIAWTSDGGHWTANLYGNNLANTAQNTGSPPVPAPAFVPIRTVSAPRTFGLSVGYQL